MSRPRKLQDKDFEPIIDEIIDGKTFREMASKRGVSISMLQKYLALEKHSARTREALLISSNSYADLGEEALKNAKGTIVEIQRARELAQHYRWKASKRAPKIYGDKMEVEQTIKQDVPLFPDRSKKKE